MLAAEFANIKTLVGLEWEQTIDEVYQLVIEYTYRPVIPLLVTGIEKGIKNVIDEHSDHSKLYGNDLKNEINKFLEKFQDEYADHPYLKQFARIISFIYKDNFLRGKVADRENIKGLNRNLVGHGNDKPNEWTKKDLYQLIAFFSSTAMLANN
ncbi:hypothetical protein [Marinococcus halotolerans]|uniref:hypothetical protein n=1 Tax=Marinococcus halotolerans TaxID=301092 RepID=UPI0003B4613D|nr:hypothetical protein [Marinococcus halotolerans]